MNSPRCLILTLAVLAAVAVPASAEDNPYQTIVTRNSFGLVPIPTGPPPDTTPAIPPPKITPNGIMTIFGKLQVLFKVANPGPPPKEESYVMTEGDRQDDIEVQKIDEKAAIITFINHGTPQELPLVAGKATGGTPTPAAPGVPGRPILPGPGGVPPPGGMHPAVGFGGRAVGQNPGSQGNATPALGGAPGLGASGGANAQAQAPLTYEEQVVLIEANRLKAMEDGDSISKILPTTPLTDQVTGQNGGDTGGGVPPGPGSVPGQ